MTQDELNNLYPCKTLKSPRDERDIIYEAVTAAMPTEEMPKRYSLRDKSDKNPMQFYGSCVGFAGRRFIQILYKLFNALDIDPSGRFIYAMCKQFDGMASTEGTFPRMLMKVLAGIGAATNKLFPQDNPMGSHAEYIANVPDAAIEEAIQYRINGFAQVWTLQGLKEAILKHGAVAINVHVYSTFDMPVDGFVKKNDGTGYRGMHEIVAIGYDDEKGAIEIANSWGEGWGDHGFAFIAYDYMGAAVPFVEAWVAVDTIDAKATSGAPVNLVYPVDAPMVITQGYGANKEYYAQFGLKDGHNGIDIRTKDKRPKGQPRAPIYAIDDGSVIFSGVKGGYGNCVMIRHSWGVSLYGHLSVISVSDMANAGMPQQVVKGQMVGRAGWTGNVLPANEEGEHLHLGGRIDGVKNPGMFDWVDLTKYLIKAMDIPDKGIATIATSPQVTQVAYVKIHNPQQWEAMSYLTGVEQKVLGNANQIKTLPIKGYMLSHDGRTVIFYRKFATPAQRDAAVDFLGITVPDTLPQAENL